jgi:hypothetical protein
MDKNNESYQNSSQSNGERKKDAAESLTSFSKHLMLLLIAVIAFASAPSLNNTPWWVQGCFIIGVVFAVASFICGHESILKIINAYIKENPEGDGLLDIGEALSKGTMERTKKLVEWQYWLALLSFIMISVSIVSSVLVDKKKTSLNCVITDNVVGKSVSSPAVGQTKDKPSTKKP